MYTSPSMSGRISFSLTTLTVHTSFTPFLTGKPPTEATSCRNNETQQSPDQKKQTNSNPYLSYSQAFPVKVGGHVGVFNVNYPILCQRV